MNKRIVLIAMLFSFFACQDDKLEQKEEEKIQPSWMAETRTNFHPGMVRIKLKPDTEMQVQMSSANGVAQIGISRIDQLAAKLGATKIERLFPPAGKFEARHREAGLHLWYNVYFDEDMPLTRAAGDLTSLPEIELVEPVRKIRNVDAGQKVVPATLARNMVLAASGPFNDPGLADQWHYNNEGTLSYSAAGADINLYEAWKVSTGSREVIVSVVDGGIDLAHEDLIENIWHNEYESEGDADVDGNGYKGDVNGWNFVSNSAIIKPHGHGTHVAGTIAAVNNNDKGVCGVAGGSGNNDGVRVMSCQIFEVDPDNPEKDKGTQLIPAAIVYGADNGAVISQNSWSFVFDEGVTPTFDEATRKAIDYFIEHAGVDEKGNQTGPMKGGIVIFAAGNENKDYSAYPASYEKVLAVASMAPDFAKAYYSNYADWVDVTAPGGSYRYGAKYSDQCAVLSTYPENKYAFLQGTSMACPHVSGIAALIVSKFGVGTPGLTPDDVRERILEGVRDIDQYNSAYFGKMGVGYVDAAAALQVDQGIAPEPVTDLTIEWASNSVKLTWSVTADEDNGTPAQYNIYVSPTALKDVNFEEMKPAKTVDVRRKKVGEAVSIKVEKLTAESDYHFAVVGVDRFGNFSEPALEEGTTLPNQPPIVEGRTTGDVILKAHETLSLFFDVTEPEGQAYTFSLSQDEAVSATLENNVITVKIEGPKATIGNNTVVLTVTDEPGAFTEVPIRYRVLENHAPVNTSKEWENVYSDRLGGQQSFNLKEYFNDLDGEILNYEIISSIDGLIKAEVSNEVLTITTLKTGKSTITIKASDFFGKFVSREFVLMSRDGSKEIELYPNPAVDVVNIRMGQEVNGPVNVKVYNSAGVLVLEESVVVKPFEPGVLNVSKLSGGTYTLVAACNGKEVKGNIVKL